MNAEGSRHLREGVGFFAGGQHEQAIAAYEQAIAAFDQAEAREPGNADALEGKVNAMRYKREAEQARRALTAGRQFSEGETEFVPASAAAPTGFVQDGEVAVERATTNASAPGEISIELNPRDAHPGAPYSLKVRLRNKSNATVFAKSLELISAYRDRQIGKGNEIGLNLRRVDAQDAATLYDAQEVWTEELNRAARSPPLSPSGTAAV